jgi:hypothetical protein
MARKRVRDFKRIAMTAKTAKFIEDIADKTFTAHARQCDEVDPADMDGCPHEQSGSLPAAQLLARGLKIGKKRATLDVKCPYSLDDPQERIRILKILAKRMRAFLTGEKRQLRDAVNRIADEIEAYADRNAMQVIAEAAL